jgi:hypothetical protein
MRLRLVRGENAAKSVYFPLVRDNFPLVQAKGASTYRRYALSSAASSIDTAETRITRINSVRVQTRFRLIQTNLSNFPLDRTYFRLAQANPQGGWSRPVRRSSKSGGGGRNRPRVVGNVTLADITERSPNLADRRDLHGRVYPLAGRAVVQPFGAVAAWVCRLDAETHVAVAGR